MGTSRAYLGRLQPLVYVAAIPEPPADRGIPLEELCLFTVLEKRQMTLFALLFDLTDLSEND